MTAMYNSKAQQLCQHKKKNFLFFGTKKSLKEQDFINSMKLFSALIEFFALQHEVCNLGNIVLSASVSNNYLAKRPEHSSQFIKPLDRQKPGSSVRRAL